MEGGVVLLQADDEGAPNYVLTVDLPPDFALNQPLSPFLLAALDLLDPESPTYALDVISMVEATLENPAKVLRAQEKKARGEAVALMKADGVDYEERMERLQEITYPKPLEDLLGQAFSIYCETVPWARDYQLEPKSVLRDMVENRQRLQNLHRPLPNCEVGRHASALPVGCLPGAGAHAAAGCAERPAAGHHRLAGLHGAHHRLQPGGGVGECRRCAGGAYA